MKDFYNLYKVGKNTKKPDSRGKSFGYQVLGFGSGVSSAAIAHRGVWAGAFLADSSPSNIIDFVEIATLGNATDFGDMSVARHRLNSSSASVTRGLWFGGNTQPTKTNIIDYVTIATEGNSIDFGDITSQTSQHGMSGNNDTRAVHCIGSRSDTIRNEMEYVTIAATGNTTDFGDLTVGKHTAAGAASTTRIIYGGGYLPPTTGATAAIDYITTASTGNAIDFGDLVEARSALSACSSGTRGVFAGGNSPSNEMDFVTIASTGNGTDFGDLTSVSEDSSGGTSNKIRGLFAKGGTPGRSAAIDHITIASTGNAADFGDRTVAGTYSGACSNGNGGLT
jgi:hypothetical protein